MNNIVHKKIKDQRKFMFSQIIPFFPERFYLDSLDQIDAACTSMLKEIDCKVKWREKFKVSNKW